MFLPNDEVILFGHSRETNGCLGLVEAPLSYGEYLVRLEDGIIYKIHESNLSFISHCYDDKRKYL